MIIQQQHSENQQTSQKKKQSLLPHSSNNKKFEEKLQAIFFDYQQHDQTVFFKPIQKLTFTEPFITKLSIRFNKISYQFITLVSKANWKYLKQLNLQNTYLDDRSLALLTKRQWIFLSTVFVGSNPITNKSCINLAKAKWKRLQFLSVANSLITKDGLKTLAKGQWPKLRLLDLSFLSGNIDLWFIKELSWSNLRDLCLHVFRQENTFFDINQIAKLNLQCFQKLQIHCSPAEIISLNSKETLNQLLLVFETAKLFYLLWQKYEYEGEFF